MNERKESLGDAELLVSVPREALQQDRHISQMWDRLELDAKLLNLLVEDWVGERSDNALERGYHATAEIEPANPNAADVNNDRS